LADSNVDPVSPMNTGTTSVAEAPPGATMADPPQAMSM
jgi:hypothetical protein